MNEKKAEEDFSVVISADDIKNKNYDRKRYIIQNKRCNISSL